MLRRLSPILLVAMLSTACAYEQRHEIQWDSTRQIWLSEASQVKVRAAQSQVFDTTDKRGTIEAVVATFQDIGFQVAVLDEELGIVSGTKYGDLERPSQGFDPSYFLYDVEGLMVFNKAFLTWGPFYKRSDLIRLTVTVRDRNEKQLIVRAAAQFYLRPIEDPKPYQSFFKTLRQAMFVSRELASSSSP